MQKNILYLGLGLGGAAIAYLAYRYMQTPSQVYSTTSVNPYNNPFFTTDPYQSYPFKANIPPRVDNSNQPWANNNREALAKVSAPSVDVNLSNTQMISSFAKSAADLTSASKSIWEDLGVSDWFDDEDPSGFEDIADFSSGTDWSGMDWGSGSDFNESWA